MNDLEAIQACLGNQLDTAAIGARRLAGVIGTAPSQYSKSPTLWNAAFHALGMDACYVPMDVEVRRVKGLFTAMRDSKRFLGINVTVPHKLAVMPYLDVIDPAAARMGAVNTIVRESDGRLSGYNTDSRGFIDSLLDPQPGAITGFVPTLEDRMVLLLGAGGSARAVAFGVAERLGKGQLILCNRTVRHAEDLAAEIRNLGSQVRAIDETLLPLWAVQADLIVNSTTKGQTGVQRLDNGMIQTMESFSSLARAASMAIPEGEYGRMDSADPAMRRFHEAVKANHDASLELAKKIPATTRFYDLIYQPEETILLNHARRTGHATMNGKRMIVCQAVLAFCDHICKTLLLESGRTDSQTRAQITQSMHQSW